MLVLVQYNTCYWALVKSGKRPAEAQAILKVMMNCTIPCT